MIDEALFKKLTIFIILGVLAVLTGIIIWPLMTSIVAGLILAYIFFPAHKKILSFVKERNVSALIVILLVLFLVFIPLWFLLPYMVNQLFDFYSFLQKVNVAGFVKIIFPSLADSAQPLVNSFNVFISGLAGKIFSSFSNIVVDLPNFALKFVVVLFVFFFGMRDGVFFVEYMRSLSPFTKKAEEDFTQKFKEITNSVIYGHIIVGILQGLATGVGLFVFGVDNALVLTIFAVLGSIIPVLGAWIIWIPSAVFLLSSGHMVRGVGLFIYGAIFVSWIDNFLRPYIISRRSKVSSAIILIGMIGGLIVFGILGLVIGPLVLAYFLLILEAYRNKDMPNLFIQ